MQMTNWTTKDKGLLDDAQALLEKIGVQLTWVTGTQGITRFRTRARNDDAHPRSMLDALGEWHDWDAELGREDLAYMLRVIIDYDDFR